LARPADVAAVVGGAGVPGAVDHCQRLISRLD
jgi:hypothetical protein